MIRAAIIFFVIAIFAFILGANGVAGLSLELGKLLLGIFLALSIVTLIAGMIGGGKNRRLMH